MRLSIIIPNYNGRQLLEKNLPIVIKNSPNVKIIIVDDGSIDGSIDLIKTNFPQIKIIQKDNNAGFSDTVNLGVEQTKTDIVILLNNDVRPKKGWLKPLLGHFKDKQVFAVGCLDKSIENNKTVLRGRGIGQFKRGFLIHKRGEINKTSTLWVSAGSGAFRRSIWEKLGGLDPLFSPFYWEDIDLSYRAQKIGYKILFECQSQVIHEHEKGAIKKEFSPEYVKSIAFRNQFIFFWKNITSHRLILSHICWLPYYLIRALINWDRAFIKGFLMVILSLPQIYVKKKQLKKEFKLKDQQIVETFQNEF